MHTTPGELSETTLATTLDFFCPQSSSLVVTKYQIHKYDSVQYVSTLLTFRMSVQMIDDKADLLECDDPLDVQLVFDDYTPVPSESRSCIELRCVPALRKGICDMQMRINALSHFHDGRLFRVRVSAPARNKSAYTGAFKTITKLVRKRKSSQDSDNSVWSKAQKIKESLSLQSSTVMDIISDASERTGLKFEGTLKQQTDGMFRAVC